MDGIKQVCRMDDCNGTVREPCPPHATAAVAAHACTARQDVLPLSVPAGRCSPQGLAPAPSPGHAVFALCSREQCHGLRHSCVVRLRGRCFLGHWAPRSRNSNLHRRCLGPLHEVLCGIPTLCREQPAEGAKRRHLVERQRRCRAGLAAESSRYRRSRPLPPCNTPSAAASSSSLWTYR